MAVTYGFAGVTCVLTNPATGASFSLIGNNAEDAFSISMVEDKNTMDGTADGQIMHNLHMGNRGTFTAKYKKNSPINALLSTQYNAQKQSPILWGQNTITLNASVGDEWIMTSVAFKRYPTDPYGKSGGDVTWEFDCGFVTGILGASIL